MSRTTNRTQARAAARLAAVQALYQHEMEGTPVPALLHEFHNHRLGATIEDVEYADAEVAFFDDVVTGVDARRSEIDALIADKLAQGWARRLKTALPRESAQGRAQRLDTGLPEELAQGWASALPGFRFIPVLSDASATDAWTGRGGFVHRAVMEDFPDLTAYQVYACGAPVMVEAARRDFTSLCRLPAEEFFADAFLTEADKAVPAR